MRHDLGLSLARKTYVKRTHSAERMQGQNNNETDRDVRYTTEC